MKDTIYTRTEILLGKENIDKLKDSHIVVCGVGGVGSYTLEAIARVGVGNITIIDKDRVDITNINRQLVADYNTIGMDKVEVAKKRVESINKEARVNAIVKKIDYDDIVKIVNESKVDYVIDCIDDVDAKIDIIRACTDTNTKCISSMGMGNRLNPLDIKISDIYKTNTCPLAKKIRKRLKELQIKKCKVVFSTELPKKKTQDEKLLYGNTIGSISFVPSVAGLVIASEVVKEIIK